MKKLTKEDIIAVLMSDELKNLVETGAITAITLQTGTVSLISNDIIVTSEITLAGK